MRSIYDHDFRGVYPYINVRYIIMIIAVVISLCWCLSNTSRCVAYVIRNRNVLRLVYTPHTNAHFTIIRACWYAFLFLFFFINIIYYYSYYWPTVRLSDCDRKTNSVCIQSAIVPHLHCHNIPICYSERRSGDIDLLIFLSFSLDPLAGHRIYSRHRPSVRGL